MSTSPLRVTHVIPQIGIGGSELQLCRLVARTPAERARQDVLYYPNSLDKEGFRVYREAGIDFVRVRRGRVGTPAFVSRLAAEIRRRRPDILRCWLASAAFWGGWSGLLAGVPRIVLSIRSSKVDLPLLLRLSRWAGGRRIHYLVNSKAVAVAVAARVGVELSRIAVIPNGIELDGQGSTLSRDDLLGAHGCPPGTRIALTVGRLTEAKNYPMLLR